VSKEEDELSFVFPQLEYALACVDKALKETTRAGMTSPRSFKNGKLHLVGPRDWCSGFFPGSLWYMYELTKDSKWMDLADRYSMQIEEEKMDKSTHDVGFKMYCSFGNGYRLTSKDIYKKILIQSAETLSKRFNPAVGAIRSWDFNKHIWQYPVIIDNMMNLELLFWATRETGDSSFYRIADAHAMTTLRNHFRKDYSSYHVVDFDPVSGKANLKQTFQGYSNESAWSRGQAWGFYGFTIAYRFTHNPLYLNHAQHIADFLFKHPNLPEDLIPYWDFNDPTIPNAPRDVSAACIVASGLYELSQYVPGKREEYLDLANKLVDNLTGYYRAPLHTHQGFLLLHSTGNRPGNEEIDVPLCYADYYYLEALQRRTVLKEKYRNEYY
jgi:hypothetical protein